MPITGEVARREHQSWLAVGTQLRQAGIDLNEDDALHAALWLWGEWLVELRRVQGADSLTLIENAEAQFNREVGFLPYHETETIS